MADSFSGIIAFAFMSTLLLLGTGLRAKIPFIRNSMVPASLISGVIGFVLISFGLALGHQSSDYIVFTFHFFTLSFMSLCLTKGTKHQQGSSSVVKGGTWLALIWTMSLAVQALVGLGVVLLYNASADVGMNEYLGLLVTHGFTQGPGQALAMGTIWQQNFDIQNAATIGLIYASFGFMAAFFLGMPIARWMIIKRSGSNGIAALGEETLRGYYDNSTNVSAGRQVTHSGNIDTLAFHISILGLAYLLTDLFLTNIQPVVEGSLLFGIRVDIIFSHNLFFLWGLITCIILRAVLDKLGMGHFIDDETQKRITGSSVDFMVIATIMSIQLSILVAYLVPLLLVTVAVTLVTALICFGLAKYLDDYQFERALTSFGFCCGSTGSGLLLLRILDPNFETPVAKELAFFNVAILVFSFHILFAMAPLLPNFSLATIALVYGATIVCVFIALFFLGFLRRQP